MFQILYGLDLSMSRSQFSKVEQLAEFLGITMDIKHGDPEPATNWRSSRCPTPQHVRTEVPPELVRTKAPEQVRTKVPEKAVDVEAEFAQALTADLSNIIPKVLAKAAAKVPRRIAAKISPQVEISSIQNTVPNSVSSPNKVSNPMLPGSLPICCWHCNESFANLDDLQTHLKTHKGELPKSSKKHKCQKCKKVSWKFSSGRTVKIKSNKTDFAHYKLLWLSITKKKFRLLNFFDGRNILSHFSTYFLQIHDLLFEKN